MLGLFCDILEIDCLLSRAYCSWLAETFQPTFVSSLMFAKVKYVCVLSSKTWLHSLDEKRRVRRTLAIISFDAKTEVVGVLEVVSDRTIFFEHLVDSNCTSTNAQSSPASFTLCGCILRNTLLSNSSPKVRRIAPRLAIRIAASQHIVQHAPVAMLALWSRATQNPGSYRCVSYGYHAAHHGSRRSFLIHPRTSNFLYPYVLTAGIAIDARG